VEVAIKSGCNKSELFDFSKELPINRIIKSKIIGLTSGASAPEKLIQNFISEVKKHCDVSVEEIITTKEKVTFKLPKALN
jgi:4-hydroxy-3-methylbut-2-enyl diphosphate reductase